MAVALCVTRKTVYEWIDQKPEFRDAMARAREESQAKWEAMGMKGLDHAKTFNGHLYAFLMGCRFPHEYRKNKGLDITSKGEAITVKISADDAKL